MNDTIVNLLLALFLLAANAFYVAAEFALVKSRGFRVNAMAEQNRFGARLLKKMVGNIEAYLACCQLGLTMASVGSVNHPFPHSSGRCLSRSECLNQSCISLRS